MKDKSKMNLQQRIDNIPKFKTLKEAANELKKRNSIGPEAMKTPDGKYAVVDIEDQEIAYRLKYESINDDVDEIQEV